MSYSFLDVISESTSYNRKSKTSVNKSHDINEASYRSKSITPLLNHLGKAFGKQFGGAFVVLGAEKYKRSDGVKGVGYRLLNDAGHQFRINFKGVKSAMSDEFSKDAMFINGIDYWAPDNNNWARASLNVDFSADCNILQIYNRLLKLIKAGKKGKFTLADLSEVNEAVPTGKDRAEFLRSKGLKASMAYKGKKKFEDFIADKGLLDEWYATIDTGAPETNTQSVKLKEVDKKFEETQWSDPATVFNDIESMVSILVNSGTMRSLIVCGMGGVGKSLAWDTLVPTPNGHIKIGELQVGDTVISANGKPTKVIGKYEHEGKDLYKVTLNDGTSFKCDKDQIFHVEIMDHDESCGVHNMSFVQLEQYLRKHPNRYATIPYCSPIEFNEAVLPVKPYLLGSLLGDGNITDVPVLSITDNDVVEGVRNLVSEQYEGLTLEANGCEYRLVGNDALLESLKSLNFDGKTIPTEYKRSSIDQRLELIRGLMDSCGSVTKVGKTSFTFDSKTLADDVADVIRSLGGRAKVDAKKTKSQFGDLCLSYEVSFNLNPNLGSVAKFNKNKVDLYNNNLDNLLCKKRRILSINTAGKGNTACIAVDDPDALYVIDGFIPVHNTFHITKTLKALGEKGKDWTYHGAMKVSPNSFFSTVFNERDRIICFDEADDILKDKDIVVMLKPLLDTGGDHRAEWSIQTAPMGLRDDDEIEAYSNNLITLMREGSIDVAWSRSISDVEKVPLFFRQGRAMDALAQIKGEVDIDPNVVAAFKYAVDDLEPFTLKNKLSSKLKTMGYEPADIEDICTPIVSAYQKIWDNPAAPQAKSGKETPTARYPSIFFFKGKMIFITNMPTKLMDQAVVSRSTLIDVQLRASDVRNRIVSILDADPSYDDVRDQLKEHLKRLESSVDIANQTTDASYTSPALKRNGKQLTVRYMQLAADMIRQKVSNWEDLAAKYC